MKQRLTDPQQWNRYPYTRGNPLRFTDPTGLYTCLGNSHDNFIACHNFEVARQADLKSKDQKVVDAAKAYGDLSTKKGDKGDNGVSVQFGGEHGHTDVGVAKGPNNTLRLEATVTMPLQEALAGGSELHADVAHEGSHVEDAQAFVNSIKIDGHTVTYNRKLNLTSYQTEHKAYEITQSVLSSEHFMSKELGLGFGLSDDGVQTAIDKLLAQDPYKVTPDAQGGTMFPKFK